MLLNRVRVLVPTVALATTCAGLLAGGAALAPAASGAEQKASWSKDRTLKSSKIVESSGLARSNYKRPLLWTHNDSGGRPTVYAVGRHGATKATLTLKGATAKDWEDMAAGPGRSLWVGDIGNNSKKRSTITVYRFREPLRLTDRSVPTTSYDFRYEDGNHNAEGIMVNPRTGRLFVVSKSQSGGAIYRAPKRLSTTKVNVLRKVVSVPKKITGATFAPGGKSFAICNYADAWVYRSFKGKPRLVQTPSLRQGESIEFARGGRALLMGSEGKQSPVYRAQLR